MSSRLSLSVLVAFLLLSAQTLVSATELASPAPIAGQPVSNEQQAIAAAIHICGRGVVDKELGNASNWMVARTDTSWVVSYRPKLKDKREFEVSIPLSRDWQGAPCETVIVQVRER
jgi:hypothetical protein